MSTAEVPSSNLWFEGAYALRLVSHSETSTGGSVTFDTGDNPSPRPIILGVDFVASGFEPIQCFVNLQVPTGIQVYYDSQSTGEGLGVRFPWRGQIPVLDGEDVTAEFSSSGTINWYVTVWGLASNRLPLTGTAS